MINIILIAIDYEGVFAILLAVTVPGMMLSHGLFRKIFHRFSIFTTIALYFSSGMILGALLLIFLVALLVGGVKYIP